MIAAPGGEPVFLNPTGSQLLATAGTGDVLTGIVAAFIARGAALLDAAAAAAWVHGQAATDAASSPGGGLVVAPVRRWSASWRVTSWRRSPLRWPRTNIAEPDL